MTRKVVSINDYVGVNAFDQREDGTKMTHREKYGTIVKAIGLKALIPAIPATREEIIDALKNGEGHLNEIPIKKWDDRFGWVKGCLLSIGINSISLAGCVCVLKEAARQWAEEVKDYSVFATNEKLGYHFVKNVKAESAKEASELFMKSKEYFAYNAKIDISESEDKAHILWGDNQQNYYTIQLSE